MVHGLLEIRSGAAAPRACELAEARSRGAMDLLESLGAAAILLSRTAEVVRANRRAAALMCSDFRIRCGRIAIAHRQTADHVEDALRRVLNSHDGVPYLLYGCCHKTAASWGLSDCLRQ